MSEQTDELRKVRDSIVDGLAFTRTWAREDRRISWLVLAGMAGCASLTILMGRLGDVSNTCSAGFVTLSFVGMYQSLAKGLRDARRLERDSIRRLAYFDLDVAKGKANGGG